MATGNTLLNFDLRDFIPESGSTVQAIGPPNSLVTVNNCQGIAFPAGKTCGVVAVKRLPATAALATGLTLKLLLAADPANPGTVSTNVVMGFNAGMLGATTAYYPTDLTGLGTEATATITLASTAGKTIAGSIAIVTANLGGGLVADTFGIFRIRRLGANSSDTFPGRVVLLGASVLDT